jgi:hypothetical protein
MQPIESLSQPSNSSRKRVELAFLQLEFSIKLLQYAKDGKVNSEEFDKPILVELAEGSFFISGSSFSSRESLVAAAENVYSMSLGLCALALEEACNEAGILKNPLNRTPDGDLRSFVYMVRCAFAHDPMWPKWEVRGHYARILNFQLGGSCHSIDMPSLDGRALELEQFGGLPVYLAMRDAVLNWL